MIVGIYSTEDTYKELTAELVQSYSETYYTVKKYKQALYDCVTAITGYTEDEINTYKYKENFIVWPLNGQDLNMSQLLEALDVQLRRQDSTVWIKSLFRQYDDDDWIISDVTQLEEAIAIKKNKGIIIKLDSEREELDSEKWDNYIDYVVDPGNIDREIIEVVNEFKL